MIEILMIEDDTEFSLFLGEYLQKYNINITNYEDPFLGLSVNFRKFDIVILDLTLPGLDGLDVCREIFTKHDIPIIISSARRDTTDKVLGLQIGADYYLPKPYHPKEMYAVIKSLLRRTKGVKNTNFKNTFVHDEDKQEIFFNGNELILTQAEYEVLQTLIKHTNAIVSRDQIIHNCISLRDVSSRSLDVIVSRIRKKLGDNFKKPNYLFSIRGMGYKLKQ